MSEFLKYVLWELQNSLILAVLAGAVALGCILAVRFLFKRKYGAERKFPWGRVILYFLFALYLAVVLFLTVFRGNQMNWQINLHLFRAWREALNNFSQHRWLNVLLNIAMFLPLGFLLPLLGKKFRKWYSVFPVGFCFSLFIELLQLALARGVFDVDDLFCNTLGAGMGFFAVMAILSFPGEKRKGWKKALCYGFLLFLSVGAIGGVFMGYFAKEFGNLPQAPAYRVDTGDTKWTLACALPEPGDLLPVYQIQTRTREDCDAFAEAFRLIIPTEYSAISYYQEAAYYMDNGSENGAHFLQVNYLDQGYDYSAIYDTDPEWDQGNRETILRALEKYPLWIPEAAEFTVEGDGWHQFRVSRYVDGDTVYDGSLRVRYGADGRIHKIENQLLGYSFYRAVEVISPEEAYSRLTEGKFHDEGIFEHKKPAAVSVLSCVVEYRVDTKGFYQPVYVFAVESHDNGYCDRILIPAMK